MDLSCSFRWPIRYHQKYIKPFLVPSLSRSLPMKPVSYFDDRLQWRPVYYSLQAMTVTSGKYSHCWRFLQTNSKPAAGCVTAWSTQLAPGVETVTVPSRLKRRNSYFAMKRSWLLCHFQAGRASYVACLCCFLLGQIPTVEGECICCLQKVLVN